MSLVTFIKFVLPPRRKDVSTGNVFSPHFGLSAPFQLCTWLSYLSKNNMRHLNVGDELANVKFSKVNFEGEACFKIFLSPFIYFFMRSIYSVVCFLHAPNRVLGKVDIK